MSVEETALYDRDIEAFPAWRAEQLSEKLLKRRDVISVERIGVRLRSSGCWAKYVIKEDMTRDLHMG